MGPRLAAALVLVTSAAVLVLEILVVRLVAPYVGLTLETYTAAIGVALAAIAAGAALGGRLADRSDPRRWLGPATAVGGALVLVARPTVLALGDGFRGTGPVGTLMLVTLAVGPAAAVLSAVPPGVVKLRLRTLDETGQTVGRLSALGTLGALAGTFLTGFVLLSALPTSRLLLGTGLLLVLGGLALSVRDRRAAGLAGAAAVAAAALLAVPSPCDAETRYYCAQVRTDPDRDSGRLLVLDGLSHSYVDLADPAHLEFGYTQRIGDVLAAQPPGALDVLHLGLGAGTVPRHLAEVRPGSTSTVLEVDPVLVDLGRDELGLPADVDVVVGDARTSVADQPSAAYDVVVGDAFGSLAVPWHLTTAEMVAEVRRVLRPGGTYVLNVIDHPPLAFARAEAATLLAAFAHVAVYATADAVSGEEGGNLVLVASDAPLPAALEQAARDRGEVLREASGFASDAPVLTDDDAPVDQLLTPYPARRS
ncbi:MAG TPA: fused MFS/spermidine synthase [Mycobacteriales bacterium]|nr:fused MFS/spermidine synthase [Mycobacteriales bacterium]